MNITENKIVKATTSKTGKFAKNFLMFLKNILMLFRKNFKELMFFLLFCTVASFNHYVHEFLEGFFPGQKLFGAYTFW